MKTKEITLYDSAYSPEREKDMREWLFELYAEDEGWKSPDDMPMRRVSDAMNDQDYSDWNDTKTALENIFKNDYYLMTGYCGTWHGNLDGGTFIFSMNDFMSAISHLEDIRIIDRNGHLIVEGSHHDGSDRYELKRLTRKGYLLADSNYFAHDKHLHETIMNNNFYSALPYFAKHVYGV